MHSANFLNAKYFLAITVILYVENYHIYEVMCVAVWPKSTITLQMDKATEGKDKACIHREN